MDKSEEFNAILLKKYGGDPIHGKIKFRELEENEILVRVVTATIHPADIAFCRGQYGRLIPNEFPIIPGCEGSGKIFQVGSKIDKSLIGKKCGLWANTNKTGTFHGLWAEYHYTDLQNIIIFDKEDIDYKTITFSMGNPLTALGFLDTLKQQNAKSVVQNGSTSAFGKMFIRLCKMNDIKNISIVRKKENIDLLLNLGAYKVISTSDEDWKIQLKNSAEEINSKICFECVGGDFTGDMISCMPKKSIIYHFGNLELKRLGNLDTSDFIFNKKIMKGFWLMEWLSSKKEEEILEMKKMVKDSFEKGDDLFVTNYSKVFLMEKFEEGFMHYVMNMSQGKIILENKLDS